VLRETNIGITNLTLTLLPYGSPLLKSRTTRTSVPLAAIVFVEYVELGSDAFTIFDGLVHAVSALFKTLAHVV
jgi:hypothetical protein